jgi:GntR family transcriptional regulator
MSAKLAATSAFDGGTHPSTDERPRYAQLVESLMRRLAAKEWTLGVQLPGDAALAAQYGVSIGTMRRAIDQLVRQHLLTRHQGKGTFVAVHDGDRALRHYFRVVADDGTRDLPTGRVVRRQIVAADSREAARLQIRPGAQVLRFLRVRTFNGVPIITERIALPMSRFSGIRAKPMHDLPLLAYEFYSQQYGAIVTEAVEMLRAVNADGHDVELLGVATRQPMLEIDRLALNISELPLEWRITHCDTRHHHYLNRFS